MSNPLPAAPVPPEPRPSRLSAGRPLVVTTDPVLLDDLLRLAAAAGAEAEVAPDVGAARGSWAAAPLVLVGADAAAEVGRRGLPRRPGVVLVGRDLDDARVWQLAVGIGAEMVAFLPDAESWLVERIADAAEPAGADGRTVCVVGGRGGAGATTLAAALGLTAARRGLCTLLVDGDPLGGGLDLALGGEDADGMRWTALAGLCGRISPDALRLSLPQVAGLALLSWDRGDVVMIPADAMRAALRAGRRGNDLVVVDLPRRTDAAAEEALRVPGALTLLVVPAEVRAAAAAARVATALAEHAADVRVVVRGPAPSGVSPELIADLLGLPYAGFLRAEPGLARAQDRGEPPGRRGRPLAVFCGRLLEDLFRANGAAA